MTLSPTDPRLTRLTTDLHIVYPILDHTDTEALIVLDVSNRLCPRIRNPNQINTYVPGYTNHQTPLHTFNIISILDPNHINENIVGGIPMMFEYPDYAQILRDHDCPDARFLIQCRLGLWDEKWRDGTVAIRYDPTNHTVVLWTKWG